MRSASAGASFAGIGSCARSRMILRAKTRSRKSCARSSTSWTPKPSAFRYRFPTPTSSTACASTSGWCARACPTRTLLKLQDDLAEVGVRFHVRLRFRQIREREYLVDHGLHVPARQRGKHVAHEPAHAFGDLRRRAHLVRHAEDLKPL